MNPAHLIARKRDGKVLEPEEIGELVRGYVAGAVSDYQMSAWAMAVCLRGMNDDETVALTSAMLDSGQVLEGEDTSLRVDKHSTGGVGDKTSFIVAPLLACCGLRVPMLSGRGLGATGGTLDKLESIPGLRTDLSREEIGKVLDAVGCVITGATSDIVPADRKLYALRDVTGTVKSLPLIVASILSKKLAEQLSALVLDVKCGSGALMKTRDEALGLAGALVAAGRRFGLATTALVTAMDQPLGRMVGNAVEIDEALEVLSGQGPQDLRELALALAGELLVMKSLVATEDEARQRLAEHLDSGSAMAKFAAMVRAQGGDLDAPRPRAPSWALTSASDGYVTSMDDERLGLAIVEMGGGRKRVDDAIDHAVGLEMLVRLGDRVAEGQPLVNIFAPAVARSRGLRWLETCITIGPEPSTGMPLVVDKVGASGGRIADPRVPRIVRATPPVDDQLRHALVEAALAARRSAYAPYSRFCVGAALLAESGTIYRGANVENASYGLTICAERTAIAAAVAAGETRFAMLAVASPGGATPCGACRQFAAEFSRELPVLLVDSDRPGEIVEWRLGDLLPAQFGLARDASDQHSGDTGSHERRQRSAEHRP